MEKNFDEVFTGDTFDGFKFRLKRLSDGGYPDITGYTIRCMWKRTPTGSPTRSSTVGDGITILDAVNASVQIDPFRLEGWQPGTYYFDVELTSPTGNRKTRIFGTLPVRQDVSNG